MRQILESKTRKLKKAIDFGFHCVKLLYGLATYLVTRKTPSFAYQSMIILNCRSNRWVTEFLGRFFAVMRPLRQSMSGTGILGNTADKDISRWAERVRTDGYVELGVRLTGEQCADLRKLSLSLPGNLESRYAKTSGVARKIYNPKHPESKTYKYDENDLLTNPTVQTLMSDVSLQALAAEYLGATPVLASVNMWWSSVMPNEKLEASTDDAAQMFHFDMSRCKWVNFFFYITDVDAEAGPHCFVKGSHSPKDSKGYHLLQRGYARIEDQEIFSAYPAELIHEITGPAGTLLVEDTKGFHKGKAPASKDRLMFEMIFTVSLFGAGYDHAKTPSDLIPPLQDAFRERPEIYSRYL